VRRWLALACTMLACSAEPDFVVGSKKFTESVILGEIARQLVESDGHRTEHRSELGGTRILWSALVRGEIDAYPEYTGTIREEIFAGRDVSERDLARELAREGVVLGPPLGFDDSYAIGMKRETATRLRIRTLSDLAEHPEIVLGLSHEFIDRADGWPALRGRYDLRDNEVVGLDHDVAYRALEGGSVGAIDLYSTDAEIAYYRLQVLEDDLGHFPRYEALFLWRADLERERPEIARVLRSLGGRFSNERMIAMNGEAKLDRVREPEVAAGFLEREMQVRGAPEHDSLAGRLATRTGEHLVLVGLSLLLAFVVALPLGVVAAKRPLFGQLVLGAVGVLQTIPSMALLVLMIPLLGIGSYPALAAMFVYSLLPILRNTAAGLTDIPPPLRESAVALGLSPWARLRLVELPMASRSILAGVKTSAVLNVGTATIGALVGAGGYGQPILTGIRLDHVPTILEGAIPAALMALAVQGAFEWIERVVVPRGLRLPR
jgi:osmoprotectant transport system permease protein